MLNNWTTLLVAPIKAEQELVDRIKGQMELEGKKVIVSRDWMEAPRVINGTRVHLFRSKWDYFRIAASLNNFKEVYFMNGFENERHPNNLYNYLCHCGTYIGVIRKEKEEWINEKIFTGVADTGV